MDSKLNGHVSRYVLVLMLLKVQGRPVFPVSIGTSCEQELNNTKSLTELLQKEAAELLNNYTTYQGSFGDSAPDEVPKSKISGIEFTEKLQDIYKKTELFSLHISKVEEYQKELWEDKQPIEKVLSRVKDRLPHLLSKIKTILTIFDPKLPLPPTPAPLQLSYDHDFAKKKYSWHVIVKLKAWLSHVAQVLAGGKEACGN